MTPSPIRDRGVVIGLVGAIVALAAVAGRGAGAAEGQTPAPEAPVSVPTQLPPPLAPGPVADLDLLFTSQVVGWIEPCG